MSLPDDRRLTQAARAAGNARVILDAATARGIRIGTDGDDLLMLVPVRVKEYRAEIIDIIQRENGGGRA
jgi:hypothetical protein